MPAFPTIRASAVGDDLVQTVNARELHAFLKVGRDFATWIKARIAKYGFALGTDYVTAEDLSSPVLGSAKARAQTLTEYHLTLDMAKELSMVENNAQGRMARRYFIDCERRLKRAPQVAAPGPAAGEGFGARLRAVSECRRAFGCQAARDLWVSLGLPTVPSMRLAPAQAEMAFGLGAAPVGGHA